MISSEKDDSFNESLASPSNLKEHTKFYLLPNLRLSSHFQRSYVFCRNPQDTVYWGLAIQSQCILKLQYLVYIKLEFQAPIKD